MNLNPNGVGEGDLAPFGRRGTRWPGGLSGVFMVAAVERERRHKSVPTIALALSALFLCRVTVF